MDSAYSDHEEVESNAKVSEMQPLQMDKEVDEIPSMRAGWSLEDWLFPPGVPRECQLLRKENIAIPACYLLVGFLQGLSSPLINVLPLSLNASEAQQVTISSIRGLPASFKLLFGFLSDNVPIGGLRRKPYMFLGWGLASLSMNALLWFSDLKIDEQGESCFGGNEEETDTSAPLPPNAPSIPFLSLSLLLFGTGFWMADVMGDSVVAEKAKLEPPSSRGSVQSSCYSYRFFGVMVAAPLSTWLYASYGPQIVIQLLAFLPLCILPLVWIMGEERTEVPSTKAQCLEIWNTVCSRAVWQPLGFVYLYNLLQVSNSAWKQFLETSLSFTKCQLNLILIVAYVLLYLGILVYKYWLIESSWRRVYIVTTLLNGLFSMLQVLLIYGITFGIADFWFALGDDAMLEFIGGVQFLPSTILMVHLCPAGSEGASYAMFTTVHNSALTLSSALSTQLLGIWDVSKAAFQSGNLTGMRNLTWLTTAIQVSAIAFVGWLPHSKDDLLKLGERGRSVQGGAIFLLITFGSICYAIFVGLMNIIDPGWMGESRL